MVGEIGKSKGKDQPSMVTFDVPPNNSFDPAG